MGETTRYLLKLRIRGQNGLVAWSQTRFRCDSDFLNKRIPSFLDRTSVTVQNYHFIGMLVSFRVTSPRSRDPDVEVVMEDIRRSMSHSVLRKIPSKGESIGANTRIGLGSPRGAVCLLMHRMLVRKLCYLYLLNN